MIKVTWSEPVGGGVNISNLRADIGELKSLIESINLRIREIQEQCSHPSICVSSVHKGNTGNYDPSADCYWTEHHCHLCDKQWTVDH